jgi:hypothetical protein
MVVLVALVLLSAPFLWINGHPDWGSDFRNVYLFHNCIHGNTPYVAAAAVCDPRWPMPFPPLLYWSFAWTRLFSLPLANAIWATAIVGGVCLTARLWGAPWLFAAALIPLFPTGFAVLTGNNDIVVVILWTAAWLCWRRDAIGWAGVWAGLAAAFKLYPAVAVALVIVGLSRDRSVLLRFLRALGAVVLAQAIIFAPAWWDYGLWLESFVSRARYPSWYAHAMPPIFGSWSFAVSGALFVVWALAARRSPMWLFPGALAISTYFGPTSNDYNLVTTYPLFARLWVSWREGAGSAWWLLIAGLFVVGHRNIYFWTSHGLGWTAVLQLVWLAGVALVIVFTTSTSVRRMDRPETKVA